MKYALLLSGNFREIIFCYPSIKKHILDVYSPDIFISCWNGGADFSDSSTAYTYGIKETANIEQIIEMFKPKFIKSEDYNSDFISKIKQRASDLECYGPMTGEMNPISVFSMWYKIQSSLKLMLDYENYNDNKYNFIIKGRFDINIHDSITINNDNDIISIPSGYDWLKGLNDIFAFGSREAMIYYCNLFDFLESYIIKDGIYFHPETLLKHHLFNSRFGIERPNIKISLRNSNIWELEINPENLKKIK